MDFQTQINQLVELQRKKTFAESPQITLGQLIEQLAPIIKRNKERSREGKSEMDVVFDFEYLFPTTIDSWRGSYSELAIQFSTYDQNSKPLTINEFFKLLKQAIGKTYTGYKGGYFTMSESTPIWVANYGNSGNTGVVGVKDNGYQVVILTAYCEF